MKFWFGNWGASLLARSWFLTAALACRALELTARGRKGVPKHAPSAHPCDAWTPPSLAPYSFGTPFRPRAYRFSEIIPRSCERYLGDRRRWRITPPKNFRSHGWRRISATGMCRRSAFWEGLSANDHPQTTRLGPDYKIKPVWPINHAHPHAQPEPEPSAQEPGQSPH